MFCNYCLGKLYNTIWRSFETLLRLDLFWTMILLKKNHLFLVLVSNFFPLSFVSITWILARSCGNNETSKQYVLISVWFVGGNSTYGPIWSLCLLVDSCSKSYNWYANQVKLRLLIHSNYIYTELFSNAIVKYKDNNILN